MFWQGGGKKRLRNHIETHMEVPVAPFVPGVLGKND